MTTAVGLLSDGPQLYRRDVAILGSTASRGNLAAYPPGKKGTIRIIAADDAGLLLSAQVVKGVPEVSWRVTAGGDRGVEAVNAVAVGSKDPKGKYLIHYASGTNIHTLDKDGKALSKFTTNSTEPVRFLTCRGNSIWTGGEYVVNLFDVAGKDVAYAMCPDKILSLATDSIMREGMTDAVVGCADRTIRVFHGSDPIMQMGVAGPVTALAITACPPLAPGMSSPAKCVVYGTANGVVGVGMIFNGSFVNVWSFGCAPTSSGSQVAATYHVSGVGGAHAAASASLAWGDEDTTSGSAMGGQGTVGSSASITSIVLGTLGPDSAASGSGHNVLVARDDGSLEVYTIEYHEGMLEGTKAAVAAALTPTPTASALSSSFLPDIRGKVASLASGAAVKLSMPIPPKLVQCLRMEESIRCIVCGPVANGGYNEVVAQTFTGRLVCISPDGMLERDEKDAYGRSKALKGKEAHILALQKENEDIRKKIQKEKERLAKAGGGPVVTSTALTATGAPATVDGYLPLARYDVIHNFVLDPADAAYVLTLEIPSSIETVVIQSGIGLDLIDTNDAPDTNASAVGAVTGATASSVGPGYTSASNDLSAGGGGGDASSMMGSTSGLMAALTSSLSSSDRGATGSRQVSDSGVSASTLLSGTAKATAAIISRTPPDARTGMATLATFRCQEASNRVQVRLRTIEGQHGELQALVINRIAPKSATLIRVPIKPLSLHHRAAESPPEVEARLESVWADFMKQFAEAHAGRPHSSAPAPPSSFPFGVLSLTGTFTLSQMHEWVAACIPDVPLRLTAEGRDEVSLVFRNVFVGTHLICNYKKGSATFKSDNPSALAILKDIITTNATSLKVRLSTTVDVPRYALRHMMSLLHAKLSYMLTLQSRAELVEAVREMVTTDGGTDKSFLHPEFQDILANADRYQKQLKMRSRMLEYTTGVATDAFVDAHRFWGGDMAHKIPDLVTQLQQYHTQREQVLSFVDTGVVSHA